MISQNVKSSACAGWVKVKLIMTSDAKTRPGGQNWPPIKQLGKHSAGGEPC